MHRVFYRFFRARSQPAPVQQVLLGLILGLLLGIWLFVNLLERADNFGSGISWDASQNVFGMLLTGLLPLILSGLLFALQARKLACIFSSALSAAILAFSSLLLFNCGGLSPLFAFLLLGGRLIGLVWLYLFLLYGDSRSWGTLVRDFVLASILTILSLLFFSWLVEPSLRELTIYIIK